MAKSRKAATTGGRRRPAEVNREDGPRFPANRPTMPPSTERPLMPAGWRGAPTPASGNAPAPPPEGFPVRTSQSLPGEGRRNLPVDTSAQRRMAGQRGPGASTRRAGVVEGAVPAPQEYLDDPGKRGLLAVDSAPLVDPTHRAVQGAMTPAPAVHGGDITRDLLGPDDETNAPASTARGNGAAYGLDDSVDLGDVDRLFLWSREDAQGVKKFLGWSPTNSLELHDWFQRVGQIIQRGKGALYAISDKALNERVGFIMLMPIVQTPGAAPVGTVHIYVAPQYRGDFVNVVAGAVNDADRLAPGVTLFIQTASQEMARLFEGFGFESGFHLVRKSTVAPAKG